MRYAIIGVDIEAYSNSQSSDEMEAKRSALQSILNEAAAKSSLGKFKHAEQSSVDTGDGLFYAIDTSDFETLIRFLDETQEAAGHQDEVRFRGVLHVGDCKRTNNLFEQSPSLTDQTKSNIVGDGANRAARYLEASPLKDRLRQTASTNFVYGISAEVYAEVEHQSYFRHREFAPIPFVVKDFEATIYMEYLEVGERSVEEAVSRGVPEITEDFAAFLNYTSLASYIPGFDESDAKFYVFPDLSYEFQHKMGRNIINAEDYLQNYCDSPRNIVISGSEQVGKTELAKESFRYMYESGKLLPIFLQLSEDYSGRIEKKIEKALLDQYGKHLKTGGDVTKVVIVDDFHLPQSRYQDRIIDQLEAISDAYVILLVDNAFNVNFLGREIGRDFELLTIEEFGPSRRNALIEEWLEKNAVIDNNYKTQDEYTDFLNTTLVRGLVPSTPLNIVVILAEKQSFKPLRSEVTTRGHCYQTLIYLALRKADIPDAEIDIYLNVLEHIAYHFFARNLTSMSSDEYYEFMEVYEHNYNLPHSTQSIGDNLHESKIFGRSSIGEYAFQNTYVYYFFVARYMANQRNDEEVISLIQQIYNNLEDRENGYIGVFIIHHLRDESILEEIQFNLMLPYQDYEPASLDDSEVDFLLNYVSHLGQITMTATNSSREHRRELLQRQDDAEKNKRSSEEVDNEEFDIDEEFRLLRKALKTAEVMGHILKTRPGSFKKMDQQSYYREALSLYMRITKRFLEDFKENEDGFLEYFLYRIEKFDKAQLDKEQLYDLACGYYFEFNLLNYEACIVRATAVLGSEPILKIIDTVCTEMATPLATLVKIHANMWYSKTIPLAELKKLFQNGNAFVQRMIQGMLVRFCDFHDVDFRDKQRISDQFEIELKRIAIPDRRYSESK